MKKTVCVFVFFVILTNYACAVAPVPSYERLSAYRDSEETFAKSTERFHVYALNDEPVLYEPKDGAALASDGTVAIISGPAPAHDAVVSVYDKSGTFQYAYELCDEGVHHSLEGTNSVFFIEGSPSVFLYRSCLIYESCIYELSSEGEGILCSYTLGDDAEYVLGDYYPLRYSGFRALCISPKTRYRFAEHTDGKLSIIDPEGGIIEIYDHTSEYRKWLLIESLPFFGMAALLTFFIFALARARKLERANKGLENAGDSR